RFGDAGHLEGLQIGKVLMVVGPPRALYESGLGLTGHDGYSRSEIAPRANRGFAARRRLGARLSRGTSYRIRYLVALRIQDRRRILSFRVNHDPGIEF